MQHAKDGDDMGFGEKVRQARIAKQMSQEQLSEATGLSKRTILNYESGERIPKKRETYAVLADALGIDEAVLMDKNVDFVLKAHEVYGNDAMRQAMDLVADVKALWAGGKIEEEDMDEIMRALQEAYWDAKKKRKDRDHE